VFIVTNTGSFQATAMTEAGITAPYQYVGGSYPGTGGDCAATLAPGASCNLDIEYAPSLVSPVDNDSIDVAYNDGVNIQNVTRDLTGVAVSPANLTITETDPYDFGVLATGGSIDHVFTVNNMGGFTATALNEVSLAAPFAFTGGAYPGTAGTCGTSLAPAAACDLDIEFAPTGTGVAESRISISYDNGSIVLSVIREVQGTGAAPALITITETDPYDFTDITQGATATHTFVLTNTGAVPATTVSGAGLLAPFSFLGGSYPGTGGDCTASLSAGASCDIVVEFAPTELGLASDTIDINYNNGASIQVANRDVVGNGIAPALLTVSESDPYEYGIIASGGSAVHTFTISNTGASSATAITEIGLLPPFSFLGGGFPGTGGDCGTTLAANSSCIVIVDFSPVSIAAFRSTMDVSYNDGAAIQSALRDVQGTGGAPATLDISEFDPYDFMSQAVGSSVNHIFTVTNNGAVTATSVADAGGLAAPFSFTGGAYPGTGGDCGTTLLAGASCNIDVSFQPGAVGMLPDTIELSFIDGATAQISTREVVGTGAAVADITITEADPYNFGDVALTASTSHFFTLENTGGFIATTIAEVGLASPYGFVGGSYPGTSGTCGVTLSSGATCTINVEFAPTASGVQGNSIDISYFDGAISKNSVRILTGQGVAPALLTLTEVDPYDYGTVPAGSSNPFTFTVANAGGIEADTMSGLGLVAPFSFLGGTYPGTGGDCGANLAVGANCTIVVDYAPAAVSPMDTDTIEMSYNNGVSVVTSNRDVQGISVLPATLTISETDPYNYDLRATGSNTSHTFVISNTGDFQASGLVESGVSPPFLYAGGGYPGTGGDCTAVLNPGTSCSIVVQFAPSTTGLLTNTIDLSYNDGVVGRSVQRDIQGSGADPAVLSLTDVSPFDFGTVATSASSTHIFTMENTGGFTASSISETTLSAPFTYVGGAYPGTGGTCGTTLPPASNCTLSVVFAPSATGVVSDRFDFTYDDGATIQVLVHGVQGVGSSPAVLTISESDPYDYGDVTAGSFVDHIFTVSNTGGVAATSMGGSGLVAPFSFAGAAYPGLTGTCGASLPAGSSCTIDVRFSPTAPGVLSDTIEILFNDGAVAAQSDRLLTGNGLSPAVVTISESDPYDYGLIANGGSDVNTFTLTNSGGSSATALVESGIATPFNYLGGVYPGTGGDCSSTLAASSSCTIVLEFAPTITGPYSDVIDFAYDDGSVAQNVTRDIQGTGGSPALLAISETDPYDYGTNAQGSSTDHTFTITNNGAVMASGMVDSGALSAPFVYAGGGVYPGVGGTCGATLAATQSCDIVVTFLPTIAGLQPGVIEINYNNGVNLVNTTRAVQGTGAAPAVLSISESDPYDFGTHPTGFSVSNTFIVSNGGGVSATAMDEVGLGFPFQFVGGTYPGTGGTCGVALAAGSTCDLIVEYAPIATGDAISDITMTYFNGASTQNANRAIKGEGVAPAVLTISESDPYSFGTLPTGNTATHNFTINNTGGFTASSIAGSGLAAPYSYFGGSYPGTGGTCGLNLNSGASCTVVVEYAPSAVSPGDDDTIQIDYSDGVIIQQVLRDVVGVAVAPANLTITETDPYNYGTLATGSRASNSFIIENTGGFQASAIVELGVAAPFNFVGGAYPGTGGDCASTLNPGNTCVIAVEYAPTIPGNHTTTIDLSYNDGVTPQNSTRDLAGIGVAPANLTITEADPFNYGTLAVGASLSHVFTIANGGGFSATAVVEVGLALPFQFTGGSFPGLGGNCASTIAPGASCSVEIEYAPTGTGLVSDTISFSYDNGATVASVDRVVQGTGAAAANISISEVDPFDYGSVTVGASKIHTFTLSNIGGVTASSMGGSGLAAPFTFLGGSYPGTGGSCGVSLANGSNCDVVVQFSPTATNVSTDTIEVNYFDGAASRISNRDIRGTGIEPANLTITETDPYDFGLIASGGTTTHTFTIENIGASTASSLSEVGLLAPFGFLGGGYPGTGGTCGINLAPTATCDIVVEYAPTNITAHAGMIDISYFNGAVTTSVARNIQGSAGAPALLTYSGPSPFDFGTNAQGSTVTTSFVIENTGAVTANSMADGGGLAAPYSFTGSSYPGIGGTCGTSLASGATCTISVDFQPTLNGLQPDMISITYTDGAILTSALHNIQGTGADPALLTISESDPYSFGNVTQSSTATHTFIVSNSGGVTATAMSEVGIANPFTFVGGSYPGAGGTCGVTLTSGGNCTLVIEYAPIATGTQGDTISLSYFDGAATTNADRMIEGVGVSAATLTISEVEPFDYGIVPSGSLNDQTFTVTNTGASIATAISGSGLAVPFSFKGGAFPGTGGNCGASLNPSASCTLIVEYAPTVVSPSDPSTITLGYNDGVNTQSSSRGVTGISVAPGLLEISDTDPYNFGTLANGATATHTFTVENTGTFQASAMSEIGIAAPYQYFGGSFPGTGGNCTATLNGGDSCLIVVEFAPTVPGTFGGSVDFSYFDGVNTVNAIRTLTGLGVNPAMLTISESDPYDFGSLAVGASTSHSFIITNAGGFTASSINEVGLGSPYSFTGGSFPGISGTCGSTLDPAASCSIDIDFTPTSTGAAPDIISLSYDDGANIVSSDRSIQGTGAAAANITISETLQNTGGVTATTVGGSGLTAPFTFLGGAFPGAGGTCGVSLAASSSCNVVVEFAPTTTGVQSNTFDINFFDGAVSQTSSRQVQGTGIPPAMLTISESDPFDFGLIADGGTTTHTFTITNSGSSAASGLAESGLAAPFGFAGGGYPGTGGSCGATLAVLGSCDIVLEYAPTTVNVDSDTIMINYIDGAVAQTATRDIQGTAGARATLDFTEAPLFDYSTQATGAVTATAMADGFGLASPFDWDGGAYPGLGGTCGASLVTTASCTLVVNFAPSINGLQGDDIQVNFNDGAIVTSSTLTVQGTGADPAQLTISETDPFDFGGFAVGSGTNHIFTVSNGGGVTANSMAEVGIGAPFAFTGGTYPGAAGTCGTTLANGANCTLDISFLAAATGPTGDTISISYFNGSVVANASRDIRGTGLAAASLTITEADPFDYGNVTVGSFSDHTFTINNVGGTAATALSGAGLAAPWSFKGGSFPGLGGDCTTTLGTSSSCLVVVTFTPSASGTVPATFSINYNDGVNAVSTSRDVTATGLAVGTLAISEADPFDFGTITVGNTGTMTFDVFYTGETVVTSVTSTSLTPPYSYNGGTYPGSGGTCGANISADCTIVVNYTPPIASAGDIETIVLDYDNGAVLTSASRDLTAAAVSEASLTISESSPFNMGSVVVGGTTNHLFVLSNVGGADATSVAEVGLALPFSFTGGTFPGTGGNCTTTLVGSTSCNLDISFDPTSTGNPSDDIIISYNDGVTTQSVTRTIEGTGLGPAALTISDGPLYDFQVHLNGSVVDHTFTIDNIGGSQASSIAGSGISAPFIFKDGSFPGTGGTCTALLNGGASCTIVVSFIPSSAGVQNDTIDIGFNDGAVIQAVSRDIQGTGSDFPDAPTSIVLAPPGLSPNNDPRPDIILSGGDVGSGAIIRLYSDAACTDPGNLLQTATAPGASITMEPSANLPLGTTYFYATLENSFGFVSSCSTATVSYEFDNAPPAQPSGVTVAEFHTDLSTSPLVTWINSASGDVATHELALADNSSGSNIAVSFKDEGLDQQGSFSGIGIAECVPYWPVVRAIDNAGNPSSPAISPTPFRVDVTNPGPPTGTFSFSGFATGSQTEITTWGPAADACGIDFYELAIGTTAGGDDVMTWADIGNVTTYQAFDGVDGLSFVLPDATDLFISVRAVDVSGKVGSLATSPAFQTTGPFAVDDLSYADRSSTSITLFWTDPGSPGSPIIDYNLYYRVTGTTVWIPFNDGVSLGTFVEVSGLADSTEYDFIVRATNGTESPDSNIVRESTGPSSVFFNAATFSAINVGGASVDCRIIAFEANTSIEINGGAPINLPNSGSVHDYNCAPYDFVEADKPIYASGRKGSAQVGWQTAKFSGKEFLTSLTRSGPHNIQVFAFETSTVTVNYNGAFFANQTLAAETGFTFTSGGNQNGNWEIVGTGLIAVSTDSSINIDPKIVPPKAMDLIGFGSTSGRAVSDGTDTLQIFSTALDDYTFSVNTTNQFTILYSGDAWRVQSSTAGISINSNADGNGSASAPFMPPSMQSNRFIVSGNTDYVAMASTTPCVIEEIDTASGAVVATHSMTGASFGGGIYRLNLSGNFSGRIFRANNANDRFHMWYQPNGTTGYQSNDDETVSFGWD